MTVQSDPITVIEAFGSTSLVQVGSNYFLNPVAGGTGPELKYGGRLSWRVSSVPYADWRGADRKRIRGCL